MKTIRGLYTLCDNSLNPKMDHLTLAQKLLAGGAPILQLRMKGEKDLDRVRLVASAILQMKKQYDFTFILNDFFELGLEIGVDGIHLGQDDLPLTQARKIAGQDFLIGYSSHSFEEALLAEQQGASYVALGAIFPTATKGPGHPVVGTELLKQVVEAVHIPTVAIGGIGRHNFSQVLSSGVSAIAMIGALNLAENISQEVEWFKGRFCYSEL